MEINQDAIEAAIVRDVADRIVNEDDIYGRVKTAVDARINAIFKETADAKIQEAIETAITKGFEHEYTRVDTFGQRKGTATTIRAELEKMIGGYWNEKVDKQGKPGSGYGCDITRAEWMMTQLVAADFQGNMKQHIINLGGALKDKLRGELHQTVNKLLSEVFHVRSEDDEAARRNDNSLIQPNAGPVGPVKP